MKVQLVVVQGKPEGKVIPLSVPVFKIGRGENCQLRPNSDQVSREHAEIAITAERVTVRDLGSRNGTIVNGKATTGVHTLKNGDLLQVGPLTFCMDIKGAPVPPPAPAAKAPSLDDVSHAEIESWLIADNAHVTPETPSGVYGGETITFESLKGPNAGPKSDPTVKAPASKPAPAAKPAPPPARPAASQPKPAPAEPKPAPTFREVEFDKLPEGIDAEESEASESEGEEMQEEFVDESNPFHVAKKAAAPPPGKAAAPAQKDSSSAANDILRKMMERRRASKS